MEGDSLAPFVVTPMVNVLRGLELARVGPSDTLLDVGCGDGRVVIAAAALCGSTARGLELETRVAAVAQKAVEHWAAESACLVAEAARASSTRELALTLLATASLPCAAGGRASVACADATEEGRLRGASVVFCSLLPDGMAVLEQALEQARRGGARLLCLHFPLPGQQPVARDPEHRLFLYDAL